MRPSRIVPPRRRKPALATPAAIGDLARRLPAWAGLICGLALAGCGPSDVGTIGPDWNAGPSKAEGPREPAPPLVPLPDDGPRGKSAGTTRP